MEALLRSPPSLHFSLSQRYLTPRVNRAHVGFPRPKFNPLSTCPSPVSFFPRPEPISLKRRLHPVCNSGSLSAAEISASKPVPAKFLGVEVNTLKKVVPLGLMFFCILFNYTILRDTKDVLVITAKGSSAEIIPFLKTWVNLPMAIGFMLLYTKLSNVLSKEMLFYSCMFPFIAFFGAFAFVLYPNRHLIHPIGLADRLLEILGPSFLGPIAILRIWSFCLFYVMSELWGSVVVSLLFWGFANQITTVDEASQFYPLFGLGANVALVFSGRTVKYFSNLRKNLGPGVDGWALSLKGMMTIVVLLGLVICTIYRGVNKFILSDPSIPKPESRKKKEKPKMTMMESMKFLLSSRYIRDLATLVVAYGISINLVEVTWKSKLKAQFPSPNEYSSFMGDFSTWTGIATFTMMLLSRVIFRKYGWGVAAAVTPTVLLITGVGFFSLILFSDPLAPLLAKLGLTPLLAAVFVGAMQNIFSKSAKYSLFDPCKEMAYIPLDEDTKVKGKAAIDVVCNPLGKSGGALIQQFLILTFGSLSNSTPYLGGILLVIVLAWLAAARSLDQQFTPLVKKDLKDKLIESKISISKTSLARNMQPKQGVTYRFMSTLNPMGFIEGKYVPLVEDVSSQGSQVLLTVQNVEVKSQTEEDVAGVVTQTVVGGVEEGETSGNSHEEDVAGVVTQAVVGGVEEGETSGNSHEEDVAGVVTQTVVGGVEEGETSGNSHEEDVAGVVTQTVVGGVEEGETSGNSHEEDVAGVVTQTVVGEVEEGETSGNHHVSADVNSLPNQ